MKKIYYLSSIIGIFIILIIVRLLTVETDLVGIEKFRVIVPKTIQAKINNLKSKILEGKRLHVKDFEVNSVQHEFYKYYISEENKEVSLNKPTGYLEQFEEKVLFVSGRGTFSFLNINDLDKKKK